MSAHRDVFHNVPNMMVIPSRKVADGYPVVEPLLDPSRRAGACQVWKQKCSISNKPMDFLCHDFSRFKTHIFEIDGPQKAFSGSQKKGQPASTDLAAY